MERSVIEDGKIEYAIVESVTEVLLEESTHAPSKESTLALFSADHDQFEKIDALIAEKINWTQAEAKSAVDLYMKNCKSIAVALKENNTLLFLTEVNGEFDSADKRTQEVFNDLLLWTRTQITELLS